MIETKNEEQLGVKNPEQIHILGSKQDSLKNLYIMPREAHLLY